MSDFRAPDYGAALRDLLKVYGRSQTWLAKTSGVHRQTLWNILAGVTSKPYDKTIDRVERALGAPAGSWRAVASGVVSAAEAHDSPANVSVGDRLTALEGDVAALYAMVAVLVEDRSAA